MTIYHKHHIVPKHMGGSDDPSNLVELTVEEHAEAHKLLYKKYGKIQDKIAWQCLSGQITISEAGQQAMELSWFKPGQVPWNKGKKIPKEKQRKWTKAQRIEQSQRVSGENNPFYGKTHSEETKRKMTEALMGENNPFYGKTHSEETRRKLSETAKLKSEMYSDLISKRNKIQATCPHCGKSGQRTNMLRWHFDKCKLAKSN